MDIAYQVHFQLKKADGRIVGETLTQETNNSVIEDPSHLVWADYKEIAVSNQETDVYLFITVMTEQHGITKGTPIASGSINLKDSLYTKPDAKGGYRVRINVKLELVSNPGVTSNFTLQMKYVPAAKQAVDENPSPPVNIIVPKPNQAKEDDGDEEGVEEEVEEGNDDGEKEDADEEGEEENDDEQKEGKYAIPDDDD